MKAVITCLYDEGAEVKTNLIGAKGFSLLVDCDGDRTLFDTGLRGRYLLHNMSSLDIDPNTISRVVISHCHESNVKGLDKLLLERENPLQIYANSFFPFLKKKILGRPMFSQECQEKMKFEQIDEIKKINDKISIIGPFGDLLELFVMIEGRDGPVVLGSCYHCGLRPVFEKVKEITGQYPVKLVGGIHLPKAKEKQVQPVAEFFSECGNPQLYLNHCAGPQGIMYIRAATNINYVNDFYAGYKLSIDI